jgi:thiamine-phosphate pyrophosphorylase
MELPRIQYITHPDEQFDDLSWVHRLHEGGVKWIQLRMKEEDVIRRFPDKHYLAFFHDTADRMRAITSALGMLLTVNDLEEVAIFSHADGLHVGQEDELPSEGKRSGFIIGGTVSSFEEVLRYDPSQLAYFGAGPLRHTETKRKLKPVLGEEGYHTLLSRMRTAGFRQPVFAIGGVVPEDIAPLFDLGVYGVAVSGAIFNADHAIGVVRSFTTKTENYEHVENRG